MKSFNFKFIFLSTLLTINIQSAFAINLPTEAVIGNNLGASMGSFSMVTGTSNLFQEGDGNLALKFNRIDLYRSSDCTGTPFASATGTNPGYTDTSKALPLTASTSIGSLNLASGTPNLVADDEGAAKNTGDCAKYTFAFRTSGTSVNINADGASTATIKCTLTVTSGNYASCSSIDPSSAIVMTRSS